jgi:hypothetical protein
LVTFEKNGTLNPIVHAVDLSGVDTVIPFSIAGATFVHVDYVAHAADGTLALAGGTMDAASHPAGFIALLSADRLSATVIRMPGFFYPMSLAIVQDGTVWAAGWEAVDATGYRKNYEGAILRHFDRSGEVIGSALPWKTIPAALKDRVSDHGLMASSSSSLGWMLNGGPYYEISLSTSGVKQFPALPLHGTSETVVGLGLTDGGDVFAGTSVSGGDLPSGYYLYFLNRNTASWQPVAMPNVVGAGASESRLLGSQGNMLVFQTKDQNSLRLFTVN